jgi:hypothetical protein
MKPLVLYWFFTGFENIWDPHFSISDFFPKELKLAVL